MADYPKGLDPGIRDVVHQLIDAGFQTTDSGDGVSKPAAGRVLDIPHVFAVTTRADLCDEADRMAAVLGKGWVVEATYSPQDGQVVLAAFAGGPHAG